VTQKWVRVVTHILGQGGGFGAFFLGGGTLFVYRMRKAVIDII